MKKKKELFLVLLSFAFILAAMAFSMNSEFNEQDPKKEEIHESL